MKKAFLVPLFFILAYALKANPLPPPPIISEVYLISDSTWYIEMVFPGFFYDYTNLDGLKISCTGGSAFFKNSIPVIPGNIIIITPDSMQSPLLINRTGDFIMIFDELNQGLGQLDEIRFGNIEWAGVNSPLPGQSLVNLERYCFLYGSYYYTLVKDNNPTIGSNPFNTASTGTFRGYVFDMDSQPVNGIILRTAYTCSVFNIVQTNSSGYFNNDAQPGSLYHVLLYHNGTPLLDSLITIEPDSINYYEFNLDTILSSVGTVQINKEYKLRIFPNPATDNINFNIERPSPALTEKLLLKIYNLSSEIVKIIPVEFSQYQAHINIATDCGRIGLADLSGLWFCRLESGGKPVATEYIARTK